MLKLIRKFTRNESGVTAIEYGLIAGFISVAIIISLGIMGGDMKTIFQKLEQALTQASTAN